MPIHPLQGPELDRVLSSVGEGITVLDADLRYVYANDAAVALSGISRDTALGRTPSDIFPPEVVDQALPHIRHAMATGEIVRYEVCVPPAGPWYENRLYPSADGVTIFFTDITARKRTEAALRESRDVLALAMGAARMGAWSRNLETGVVWWSRELEGLFGLEPGGFEGTEEGFLAYVRDDDRPRIREAVSAAIEERRDYVIEFQFRRGAEWCWMEGRGRAVYDETGRPLNLYGIGMDITGRKAFEAELAAARDAAEAASHAKDEFLAMLGHELRNPLSPIVTALQLMKLRGGDAVTRERTVIERQVTHLTRLVDDLLDVSRIARGKVELKREHIELAEVTARAIEIASPLLEERAQALTVDVPPDGLAVEADPGRLSQVLSNLLTNASKYTPPNGQIAIGARREDDEVVIRVRDTGMGVPADVLPRVFDLFVQGPRTRDRALGGLGLGLSIVRSLVEAHGGRVEARSEGVDRGSEFLVTLPGGRVTGRPAPAGEPAITEAPDQRRARVLLVDDNQDGAEMMAAMLKFRGFEPAVAVDGPSALELARRFRPVAALLDLGLPVMDGFELGARLREIQGLETIMLIAVTGYGQQADRERTAALGFAHHLVKPVDLEALEPLLETIRPRAGSDPAT